MKSLKVAGATLNQTPFSWDDNIKNIVDAIEAAKGEKVDLLCLPELCITGYGCEDTFLSNWISEEAMRQVYNIIPHTSGIMVSVGLPVIHKAMVYNCSCIIQDQQILGFVAKQFLANDGVHYETRWFTSWKPGLQEVIEINNKTYPIGDLTFTLDDYKIGLEICEDAWREDLRPAIKHAEKGVDIILNPSASHFSMGKANLRKLLVSSSSERFKCLYIYANLLGNESGRMIFDGDILIGLQGNVVKRNRFLSYKSFNLITFDYNKSDPGVPAEPSIDDPDVLKKEFTQAASLALFDYLRKSRSRGFTLSLSGGADSSACAVLVAHMIHEGVKELGVETFLDKINRKDILSRTTGLDTSKQEKVICENILTCAYQGTKNSSKNTFNSAQSLAEYIGAKFYSWIIDDEVKTYTEKVEKALGRKLEWSTDDIALQNIQARARSPIIWMIANIENSLLITTSNRSEGDVGYATMDGDTSGSIAPIAAIDKHFLLVWLKWMEESLGYKGLAHVNALTPSAELRPGDKEQTDEKDLMPYHVIVQIERLAIKERKDPLRVYRELARIDLEPKELLKAHIEKFFRLWARNQWKRERTAPAFHLDDFNVDPRTWCRFPILSGGFEKELEEMKHAE